MTTMTWRSCSALLAASLLVLAPLTHAFAPRLAGPRTSLNGPLRHTVAPLHMKNMFNSDDDFSLDSFWKKPAPSKIKYDNSLDSMMNLFSKKESIQESDYMQQQRQDTTTALALGAALLASVGVVAWGMDVPSLGEIIAGAERLIQDPNASVSQICSSARAWKPVPRKGGAIKLAPPCRFSRP